MLLFVTLLPLIFHMAAADMDISSRDIWRCIQEDDYVRYRNVTNGTMTLSDPTVTLSSITGDEMCVLHLTIPPGHSLWLKLLRMDLDCIMPEMSFGMEGGGIINCESREQIVAAIMEGYVKVFFPYYPEVDRKSSVDVYIEFGVVKRENVLRVQRASAAHKIGHVETPFWGTIHKTFMSLNSSVTLTVPSRHSTFLSFPLSETSAPLLCNQSSTLQLTYRTNVTTRNNATSWTYCWGEHSLHQHPRFTTYAEEIDVSFHGDIYNFSYGQAGFRMLFSHHPQPSEVPVLRSDRLWNCSVPRWEDFERHFPCDLVKECLGGEDEEPCPYTDSSRCSSGQIWVGGTCYEFVTPGEPLMWWEAVERCHGRGGHLASLDTPREWNEVMGVLRVADQMDTYLGMKSADLFLPAMYQDVMQWSRGSIAHYLSINITTTKPFCTYRSRTVVWPRTDLISLATTACSLAREASFLCEYPSSSSSSSSQSNTTTSNDISPRLKAPSKNDSQRLRGFIPCPGQHLTHDFLAYDTHTDCWKHDVSGGGGGGDVTRPVTPLPPSFRCSNRLESVPYSLVCDFRVDCSDESDEDFCVFPPCEGVTVFDCGNGQCVPKHQRCDKVYQCVNEIDERKCGSNCRNEENRTLATLPPAVVQFTGKGNFTLLSLQTDALGQAACPETHFACPALPYYCMPVYVRCNGVRDCPGLEDEGDCGSYSCAGYYRCRGSIICVHPQHLRDGIAQCPEQDDELVYGFQCPARCRCYGLSVFCHRPFEVGDAVDLRYLDASHSGTSVSDLLSMTMLVYLSLQNCRLLSFDNASFSSLLVLDLSYNDIVSVQWHRFKAVAKLRSLSLAGNPVALIHHTDTDVTLPSVVHLDMSSAFVGQEDSTFLQFFPHLQSLNISGNGIQRAEMVLPKGLRKLDVRGNSMEVFPKDLLCPLQSLETVYTDNYKLCCPAMLPLGFNAFNCHAPSDEISSCEAMLRSTVYRVFLSVFAVFTLLGNLCSFIFRVLDKTGSTLSYGVFVIHLCVSDFVMGVYLAIIGVADRVYQGTYLWNDINWRNSVTCTISGFLSLISSEVSAFNICLITLDRFLVLQFPFSRVRFGQRSAHVACLLAWCAGTGLALLPLLPVTSRWQFYRQKSICIPLPITRSDSPGHAYSFGVMVCLNFVLFLLIALGQAFIYWSVRVNSMATGQSNTKSKDLTIAQRLISVAVSDFLCWFPIGLLGVLASRGVAIPGEVNVAMALLVLPLNSTINPFLYTLNILLEKRRRAREQRLEKLMETKVKAKLAELTAEKGKSGSLKVQPGSARE